MKILVLELARLGDIFQTWPALRGLKRVHPQAQIDVLTRKRFQAALDGLEIIHSRKILPTREIFTPLLEPQMDVKTSYDLLTKFVEELRAENYDWILNFSFSPFSSYLTHALSMPTTKVCGYSRTADGYLAIPDDMSAYFYAQVGVGRPNRFHLAEVFGTLAGLDLEERDWAGPVGLGADPKAPAVLVHVGASESKKQVSPVKWATILNQFMKIHDGTIGLIGSDSEKAVADQIMASIPGGRVTNFVGQTDIASLFSLIKGARLLVGADSAPMHMASLTRTPCLNLSLSSVNFWETGPRAPGSYVMRGQDETDFASDRVALAMKRLLFGEKQELSLVGVQKGAPSYWCLSPKDSDFEWKFVKALYMQEEFPPSPSDLFRDGILKLADINLLMMDQMVAIQNGVDLKKVASIIDRGEEIIETIGKLVAPLAPLVRWYQTEKIRIGPDTQEKLLEKSLNIQNQLQQVLNIYLESFGLTEADLREQQDTNQEEKR